MTLRGNLLSVRCSTHFAKVVKRRSTFDSLTLWVTDARALASPDMVAILVGTKVDREDEREVPWLEASRWAKENGKFSIRLICPHSQ